MNPSILHKSTSRGSADHGWLKSHHSFSFANYRNAERIHFGVLRVLNDDWIQGGMGFGTHPHENMEIITLPLQGALAHKDSMGNGTIIRQGDIQVMSAGTGIEHSEYNASETEAVELLQIWLFPNQLQVTPRYDQRSLNPEDRINKWQQILSPNPEDDNVWIHQDAWFYLSDLQAGKKLDYRIKKAGQAVYAFVISGALKINGQLLDKRDAMGFWDTEKFDIEAVENSQILLMDLPKDLPEFYQ